VQPGLAPASSLPLAIMEPGPELAAELAAVCAADLSDDELVDVIRARERQVGWAAAGQLDDLMEFARRRRDDAGSLASPNSKVVPDEFAADEIGCALTLTSLSANRRLMLAVDVSQRMPRALDALRRGLIDLPKLRVLDEETAQLTDDLAAMLADEALADAATKTTGQIRYRLRRRVRSYLPKDAAKTPEEAEDDAREQAEAAHNVWLRDLGDGNAELGANLGAGDAATAWSIIDNAAKTPGDKRTIGQRRADALKDLLQRAVEGASDGTSNRTSGGGSGPRTLVNVTIPLTELVKLTQPEGHGAAPTESEPGSDHPAPNPRFDPPAPSSPSNHPTPDPRFDHPAPNPPSNQPTPNPASPAGFTPNRPSSAESGPNSPGRAAPSWMMILFKIVSLSTRPVPVR
jgi:hypothetical protein